ncbi:MAG: uroporphyrinogen-III C-methyltransferase [Actinobacteria bacterium]|nr:uroporphyrinogen-III C-methyltransferase [Actinomycetota bacterium]MCL6104496.1 uroporphyrinogen-III C-methyltransferase [Actinomycetota bacterium]
MTVYLLGAGPGDPGLITVRGAEVLSHAEVVLYDRLIDKRLLELAPPEVKLVDVGKVPGKARMQDKINSLLVSYAKSYTRVVRLKGGDPFVFGRGAEEVKALTRAKVDFQIIPGISSATGVPTSLGIPLTYRQLASVVTLVTGHIQDAAILGAGEDGAGEDGAGEASSTKIAVDWEAIAKVGGTIVLLMGVENRKEISSRLIKGGRLPSTPVAAIEWGTWDSQRILLTTLGEMRDVDLLDLNPPAVIVIGDVVGLAPLTNINEVSSNQRLSH